MSRAKFAVLLLLVCLLGNLVAAQPYSIRVTYNSNLRASHSLDSRVVATARAGTILQVIGHFNSWLNIERNGSVWMANWVPHTRVTGTAESSEIDNCCYVDRQCASDKEWVSGYWAFQRNECPLGPTSTDSTGAQPTGGTPAEVDNCCFTGWECNSSADWDRGYWAYQRNQCGALAGVDNCCFTGWQCHSDADWVRGYAAFQNNQCDASQTNTSTANSSRRNGNISIEGSRSFRVWVNAGLDMLKTKAPRWYDYVQGATRRLKELPYGAGAGVDVETRTHETAWGVDWVPSDLHIFTIAHEMIHEACHIYQYRTGDPNWYSPVWRAEKECMEKQLEAAQDFDPNDRFGRQRRWRNVIANMEHDKSIWWWD